MEEDLETIMKIIVVGNGRIGKTTMITRFVKGSFTAEYKKTLGVDFLERRSFVKAVGQEIIFHLWDTAGQEEYDQLTKEYYKGASACVLAFSTTDRDSFEAVARWKQKVEEQCGSISTVLVQTKTDLKAEAVMTEDEIRGLASKLKLRLFQTTSKENINIKEVFEFLAELYLKGGGKERAAATGIGPVTAVGEIKKRDRKNSDSDEEDNNRSPQKAASRPEERKAPYDGPEDEASAKKKKKKKKDCTLF
eukprot:TRINITY_DN462_c0_g1_i3.p1 TRINITY_DN462_c0_g1~~TRINITY_DN462_c0_g1_i3.p1  ORF type:complete len:249 (+),score=80.23 TRINITY_DN462_c0_g1_i3:135-881(+)